MQVITMKDLFDAKICGRNIRAAGGIKLLAEVGCVAGGVGR